MYTDEDDDISMMFNEKEQEDDENDDSDDCLHINLTNNSGKQHGEGCDGWDTRVLHRIQFNCLLLMMMYSPTD